MTDKSPVSGVNLPRKFFDVATDPCDHNPFPAEDPRHGIWRRATRRAEEKLSELAELMPVAYRTRLENEWKRVESELFKCGRPLSTISMSPLLVPYYQGTFDIWAWRNLAAIAADGDLLIYDRWLLQYAQNWIELIEGREEPEGPKRSLVNDLQTALQGRIAHWKSEARKHLRSQEEQYESGEAEARAAALSATELVGGESGTVAKQTSGGVPATRTDAGHFSGDGGSANVGRGTFTKEGIEPPPGPTAYPKRAAWFQKELAHRGWNVHTLQAHGGPDWKTSRKILDGLSVSRSVLEKAADVLSTNKTQLLFRDIPQE